MLPLPTVHKRNIENGDFPSRGFDCVDINDEEIFKDEAETTTIKSIYSPGHTDDHVAFIIEVWFSLFYSFTTSSSSS